MYIKRSCVYLSVGVSPKVWTLWIYLRRNCVIFFLHLFVDKNLQPVTIKGYRSAIAFIYRLIGVRDPGTDFFLSALISNFEKERPTPARLFPKWSLDIVLQYLSSSTFEPSNSASLAALTYKCVFLITLATALRVGEVHALSARQDCLRRNIDGSITLLTFPGFVAKTSSLQLDRRE